MSGRPSGDAAEIDRLSIVEFAILLLRITEEILAFADKALSPLKFNDASPVKSKFLLISFIITFFMPTSPLTYKRPISCAFIEDSLPLKSRLAVSIPPRVTPG